MKFVWNLLTNFHMKFMRFLMDISYEFHMKFTNCVCWAICSRGPPGISPSQVDSGDPFDVSDEF